MTTKQFLSDNSEVFLAILEHLNTPIALSVYLQIKAHEWDDLALRWVDPRNYPEGVFNALRYRSDVQAVDLLRKYPLPTTFDRREAAIRTFEVSETACYQTNEFILRLDRSSCNAFERGIDRFLRRCQKTMARWLGPIPASLEGRFGPGTCVEYEGAQAPTVPDKIGLTPTATPDALPYFLWEYNRTLWGAERWKHRLSPPQVTRGNRFATVPKDGKTDRSISIEPLGNLWLQLGIGSYLKRRCSYIGLPALKPDNRERIPGLVESSEDAQAVHRRLLYRCRREGFSTIDLSSASDTVATELIRRLLPPDWFRLLDDCRSKWTLVPSKRGKAWYKLEKFSSMGNGFTFELETLVFSVLLSVAFGLKPGVDLWVFGDDIIVPSRVYTAADRKSVV